ncbi:peptidoglycan-binding domain-containing protein [Pseudoalteromonas sp. T1lg65]|uniref:peptidoglycan-binding domain-containing protein n=1 Tax=Pseudoalteromonas sp. T1lg65 TaxID=2077101 RepID=UPI003F78FD57
MNHFMTIVFLVLIFSNSQAYATSGRTNSEGCHNSKKVGYHCHGSPKLVTRYKSPNKPKQAEFKSESVDYDVKGSIPQNFGLVFMIQHYLKERGHYDGELNGDFDSKTKDAIESFQRKKGLDIDGQPTIELMQYLSKL